jgi:hypothetical protein
MPTYFVLGQAPKQPAKKKTRKQRQREREREKRNLAELLGQNPEVGGQRPGTWPQTSLALAVHPKQVAEANQRLKAAGSTAYHKPDGSMVIPDAGQRKKVIKMVPHRVDLESFS